jgi:hypothetical protein
VFPFQQGQYNLATRPKTLPIPGLISNSAFDEICESFKISPKKNRDALRAVIDGATAGAAEFMKEQSSQPPRRDDRKLVDDAISALNKAQQLLERLGPHGEIALSIECERILSPLVSTRWLCQQFPADSLAPRIAGLVADFDDRSLDQRRLFIARRPLLVVNAILAELGRALNGSELFLRAKGGRKRATARHNLICSLVHAWNFKGRKVSTGPKSDFVQFVEAVLVSTGWSDRGILDAVADAVRDLRNRAKKKLR